MRNSRNFIRATIGLSSLGLTTAASSGAVAQQVSAANGSSPDTIPESVVITGQRSSLNLLPETLINTPQSIDVVPAQVIQEQGVSNLEEALKNVPGITLNAGEGGTHGDLVNLRGFPVTDDFFLDGLRDTGLYDRDSFDYDSVEVLKGPSSTLFGRGTTGGVINQVSKSPLLHDAEDFTLTGGTNSEIRGTADLNYLLGDTSALRLNVMGQRSDIAGEPYARAQRWGIAPAFGYGLGAGTEITVKYLHQQEDNLPFSGVPFLFGLPAPVPTTAYYGLPSDDRFKTDIEIATGTIKQRIDDVFTITDSLRYGRYWFDARVTSPHYGNANCYTTAPYAGSPLCSDASNPVPVTAYNPLFPVVGTPLDQIFVQRDRPSSEGVITTMMNETDVAADFQFGILHNHLIAGIQLDKEDAALDRFFNQISSIVPTPLLAPNLNEAFPGPQTQLKTTPVTRTATDAAYIMDNIDIGAHLSVVAALRFDHFGANYTQPLGTPSQFTRNDNIGSPRAAIVYKPFDGASAYVSYATSFNPSAETLTLAASDQGLSPERDHTFEAGGKIAVLQGLLSLSAAAFNTVKTNARISDPDDPGLQELAGTERVNGLEFDAQGYVTENWELIAGYTYLAPRAVGLIAAGVAGPIPNVARDQANLWTVYDFDSGLKLGAGLNWTGHREAGADNMSVPGTIITATIPSYATVDAMLSYPVTDRLTLSLNGYNLTNRFYFLDSYYSTPAENHLIPGPGRTVFLTADLRL